MDDLRKGLIAAMALGIGLIFLTAAHHLQLAAHYQNPPGQATVHPGPSASNRQTQGGTFVMQVIIDRFEGRYAVIELPDRSFKNIPRHILPTAAKEGDVLEETDGQYQLLPEATKARGDKIRTLMDDVWDD